MRNLPEYQLWQPKGKFCLFFWSTIWWEHGLVKIAKIIWKNTFEKKKEKPGLLVLKVENYILLSNLWRNFSAKNRLSRKSKTYHCWEYRGIFSCKVLAQADVKIAKLSLNWKPIFACSRRGVVDWIATYLNQNSTETYKETHRNDRSKD